MKERKKMKPLRTALMIFHLREDEPQEKGAPFDEILNDQSSAEPDGTEEKEEPQEEELEPVEVEAESPSMMNVDQKIHEHAQQLRRA